MRKGLVVYGGGFPAKAPLPNSLAKATGRLTEKLPSCHP